jgi:hypothetical protein
MDVALEWWTSIPLSVCFAFVLAALLFNTFWLGASWPYVLGVVCQLLFGFMTFTRLLLDSWHAQP